MSAQAFQLSQLDPSIANLSPALLKKRYDELTPEERRALGFTRLATDEEIANAPQPRGQGAPADFGGPVLPNPNGIKISADTDPGGEVTRLPNGVSFQKGNWRGAMPGDISNPPQTQVAAPAMQTASAKSADLTPDQFMAQQAKTLTPDQFMAQQNAPSNLAEQKTKDYTSPEGAAGEVYDLLHGAFNSLMKTSGPNVMYEVLRKNFPQLKLPQWYGMPTTNEVGANAATMMIPGAEGEGAAEGAASKAEAPAVPIKTSPQGPPELWGKEIPQSAVAPPKTLADLGNSSAPAPKVSTGQLDKALNDALGGKPLQKGVPLKNQNLPQRFTPVDSTVLKGYKYDPTAREFESITTGGQHYIHGDVSPEEADAFEAADSKGKAWQQIRQNPLVAKVVNGNRVATKPASVSATPEGEATPLSQKLRNLKDFINEEPPKVAAKTPKVAAAKPAAPASDDLTSLLQQSVDQAGKGVFTSAEPKALLDRWGVDPESFAEGREQTRGMSPQESAASIKQLVAAYKKGEPIEPVIETRDAGNNIVDVDGRGRALAAHKAGIKRIPIIVRRTQ